MGRTLGRLGIAVGVFAVTFVAVDAVVVPRLILPRRHLAYASSEYWSQEFVKESRLASDLSSDPSNVRVDNGVEWRTISDFQGQWITVQEGQRLTLPQVAAPRGQIVVLGGSTVFCAEVPDALTWPSQLAVRVANERLRVVNLGAPGSTLRARIDALRGRGVARRGDRVVYFVGVNEAVIGEQTNESVGLLASVPQMRSAIERWFHWSNLGRHLLARSQVLSMTATAPAEDAVARFLENLVAARQQAAAVGFSVVFVIQPSALVSYPQRWGPLESNLDPTYVREFRRFFDLVLRATATEPDVIDGTRLLDGLERSPYLDQVHVQEDGNRAIADFVYAELERRGWLE